MEKFKFIPKIGMKTNDSYLHGIGENECICCNGIIEEVGEDWFVLRVEDYGPLLVSEKSYWVIEEEDFH